MKILIGLLFILSSLTVSAQSNGRRGEGRIVLRDGQSTVRIEIGNNADLNSRVRRLEEAVRDLQNQVYDLRDQPRTRVLSLHVCSLKTTFDGTFVAKATTRIESEAMVRNQCEQGGGSFCSSAKVNCELTEEVVDI